MHDGRPRGRDGDGGRPGALDLAPARNRLLAALRAEDPAAEVQLRVGLETVELKLHARVMAPDRPIRHVYFPETGVLFGGTQTVVFDNTMINATTYTYEPNIPTSKDQCKHGGYKNFTDANGQAFKNQGQCEKFVKDAAKGGERDDESD